MQKLFDCINGNAQITLFDDGTRIIASNDDCLNLDTPLSLDIKLTNKCFNACAYCYEQSNNNGKSGNLDYNFLNSLPSTCEYNVGGGNIFDDWELFYDFAYKIGKAKGIMNTTVNLKDFMENAELLWNLQDLELLRGIGVSYNRELFTSKDFNIGFFKVFWNDNNIMHIINGLITKEDLWLIKNAGVKKILVLGMKNFGNGKTYLSSHSKEISENSKSLVGWLKQTNFDIVSYDNLALAQLNLKDGLNVKTWNALYQGEDGTTSFYIDLTEGKFARNSITPKDKRHNIGELSIKEMFNIIKDETHKN